MTSIPRAVAETRAITMLGGTMWVLGGGRDTPNPSNQVDVYDPVTDTWTTAPSFVAARRNFPADVDPATGAIYLVGGYATTTPTDNMEIYAPGPCPTPIPTDTAVPTDTPEPTDTAMPTDTPMPTDTSVPPTDTPEPPTGVQVSTFNGDSGSTSGLWLLLLLALLPAAWLAYRKVTAATK